MTHKVRGWIGFVFVFFLSAFYCCAVDAFPENSKESMKTLDKHVDGKPDQWIYYRNGKVVRHEWDRNFDGKPDLRMVGQMPRYRYKEYDHNFDGTFDKREYPAARGSSGKIKSIAVENETEKQG